MGWLRLVGSLKLQVSFAKEPYKWDCILHKRPITLRSLLIEATPYCIWSVIQSRSPISISLVSFQRNAAKETWRTRSSIEIWDSRNDTPNATGCMCHSAKQSWLYICVQIYVCVWIDACMSNGLYPCTVYVCICVLVCICVTWCVYVCKYVQIILNTCYVYIYIHTYTYVCAYKYICLYVHAYT